MDLPEIIDPFLSAKNEPRQQSTATVAGVVDCGNDSMDMWQYFVDHIDEFPVAKSIVDHFDANAKDLLSPKIEVDVYALYLRAKITLKRDQVAYKAAQDAVAKAREQSRGLRGAARAVTHHVSEMRRAILAQPQIAAIAVAALAYYLTR